MSIEIDLFVLDKTDATLYLVPAREHQRGSSGVLTFPLGNPAFFDSFEKGKTYTFTLSHSRWSVDRNALCIGRKEIPDVKR